MTTTNMKIEEDTLSRIESMGTCRDSRADVLRILLYYWDTNHPDGCSQEEWGALRSEALKTSQN